MNLPIWMYWEGPCPDWILACQETVFRHGGDVRLLGPRDLDQIQGLDRDLDFSALQVAHRADYVRAFLLARYGGLWIDSDCVVMQSLEPILDLLEQHDFLGHFERQGRISNAFIASRPRGFIATAYYRQVRELVRSGQPLSWLSLGAHTLMEVLRGTGSPWYRLGVELVQPVCWSNPGAFFTVDTLSSHERAFNSRSICYMLSHNTVNAYLGSHLGADLLHEGTFFTYLLRRCLAADHRAAERTTVRGMSMQHGIRRLLAFGLDTLQDVLPARVLDVGLGFGRWGMLVREVCDEGQGCIHRENWRTHIEAVTATPNAVEEYHHFFYDWIHVADPVEFVETVTDRWDLIIIEQVPQGLPATQWRRLLDASLDRADYVLMLAPIASEGETAECPALAASELLALQPARHTLETIDGRDYGGFLLSRTDPRDLRTAPGTLPVFSRIFQDNLWLEGESRSGPGSSLLQTATIRREIPALLASLGIRSLLHAPCGDVNWMRHADLGVERYIGVDVVPEMIARNQLQFASQVRRFLTLDLAVDPLPRVDLVLCRDGLVHMSFECAFRVIANFRRSGSTYLLATTFLALEWNQPADTGAWRPLNLQLQPFSFPEPIMIINEGCTEGNGRYMDKSLALWRLADLTGKSPT